jgi:hypothetical protein
MRGTSVTVRLRVSLDRKLVEVHFAPLCHQTRLETLRFRATTYRSGNGD